MVTVGASTAAPTESSRRMGPRFSRGRRPCGKVVARGIKLYYRESDTHDSSTGPHGLVFTRTTDNIDPRHQPAADTSCLRRSAVCLSGQSFSQPCARQYLDGGACRRRLLPHLVLAVFPDLDRLLL